MVEGREETPLTLNRGSRKGQADGYVVSRLTGRLAVTALGNPSRDLGFFPVAQSAAAVILADAAGSGNTRHGARFALEFLAPLEDPSPVPQRDYPMDRARVVAEHDRGHGTAKR